jgi:cytochrome c oxidase assembly protein subunit 15
MNQLCADDRRARSVGLWLLALAGMILVNVALGGLTRLTGSGLSMVEWQPFTLLPPLSEPAWAEMFAKYQDSPQFHLVNEGMDLAGFKSIFWLEYIHRNWGRLLGFAFLIPFLTFLVKGFITRREIPALAILFVLGAGQGVLGWAMVASGLRDRPEVSHYRLAAHLFAALVLYAALLWTGFSRLPAPAKIDPASRSARTTRRHAVMVMVLLCITIPVGALVAGLHAGLYYNSFPLMGDQLLPDDAWDMTPTALNFVANPVMVQFVHRVLGILTWLTAISLLPSALRSSVPAGLRWRIALVPAFATLQFALGVATLLSFVAIPLAVMHQVNAFLLFGAAMCAYSAVRRSGA